MGVQKEPRHFSPSFFAAYRSGSWEAVASTKEDGSKLEDSPSTGIVVRALGNSHGDSRIFPVTDGAESYRSRRILRGPICNHGKDEGLQFDVLDLPTNRAWEL